ncbi:hypothetical protein E1189_06390 [Sansalvadorimonas verongulae]|nr:hypothetical protein [Sansalvadorimonas verongulae]
MSRSELAYLSDFYLEESCEECRDVEAFREQFAAKLPGYLKRNQKTTMYDLQKAAKDIEYGGEPIKGKDRGLEDMVKRILNPGKMQKFDSLNARTEDVLASKNLISPEGYRFRDVKCPDDTCVNLWLPDEHGTLTAQSGKIHASYMPVPDKTFAIATQYPKNNEQAMGRFWKTAVQHETSLIVDLTQAADGLTAYYPKTVGKTTVYDGVKVTLTQAEGKRFTYHINDTTTGQTHQVSRLNVDYWVDKEALSVKDLSNLVAYVGDDGFENIMVHCKAGIGRTGTVMTGVALLNMMRKGDINPNKIESTVERVILDMRGARGGRAVQTADQLQLLKDLVASWFQNGTP